MGLCNILIASCPSARWSTEELSPGEILVTAFVSLSFDIFHNYFKSTMIWDCRFHKLSYPNKHRSFSCMLLLFLYEWGIWLVFKIYEAFLFWCSFLRDNRIALPASVSKGNLHWAVVKMRVNKSVFINNAAARGVFRWRNRVMVSNCASHTQWIFHCSTITCQLGDHIEWRTGCLYL